MSNSSYVKSIKFTADTTQVLNKIKELNVNVDKLSRDMTDVFASSGIKKALSDFRKGFTSAFDTSSDDVKELKQKLSRLNEEKAELLSAKSTIETQLKSTKKGTDEYDELTKALEEITDKIQENAEKVFDTTDDLNVAKEKEELEAIQKLGQYAGKKLISIFESIGKKISDFISDMFNKAIEKLDDIAGYDLQNTTVFNQEALSLATDYGLTGSDAYAAQKASEQLGYGSVDTLIDNLWNMNDKQREQFNEYMQMYRQSYENDKELATNYQQFKFEWQKFQEELQMDLLEWFSNNKDTIKSAMELLISFMKSTLEMLSTIASVFGNETERSDIARTSATTDIINSYKNSNTSNVSVSNTFNVSGGMNQSNSELKNAGSTIYRQIMKAFE